jgi:hypothetical protein
MAGGLPRRHGAVKAIGFRKALVCLTSFVMAGLVPAIHDLVAAML